MKNFDLLGPKVEMGSKKIKTEGNEGKKLRDIGRDMAVLLQSESFAYAGSFATHIYISKLGREIRYAHHHGFEQVISEKVVSAAVADQALHLMEVVFNRKKPSTTNKKDQRGKKE